MRRIISVLAVVAVMAALMVATALPAFAQGQTMPTFKPCEKTGFPAPFAVLESDPPQCALIPPRP
jgi:hypothetical protein